MKIEVNAKAAQITERETLTVGSKGIMIAVSFSPEWDGLHKTALFWDGEHEAIPVLMFSDFILLPPEMTATKALKPLVTFVGKNADGTVVFPAVECPLGSVWYGIREGGYPVEPPTPDWIAQIEAGVTEANRKAQEALDTVTDNLPLTERAEAAAKAAEESAKSSAESADSSLSSAASSALSANKADASAKAASGSATDAQNSQVAASASASESAESAKQAKGYADEAGKQATASANSAEAAKKSAASAKASETIVKADADRASKSATAAQLSAEATKSSEDSALESKQAAEAASANASASATAASQSATAAAGSADEAKTDAAAAVKAAETATTQATKATTEADRAKSEADRLSIKSAKVGDLIKVKAVDAQGVPTEWEPTTLDELEGKWELIEEGTTAETAVFQRTSEPSGKEYDFQAMIFKLTLPASTKFPSGAVDIKVKSSGGYYFVLGETWMDGRVSREKSYWFCKATKRYDGYDYISTNISQSAPNMEPNIVNPFKSVPYNARGPIAQIAGTVQLPAGTKFEVWAVRA